jgi:CheY-like chemotaxis protein
MSAHRLAGEPLRGEKGGRILVVDDYPPNVDLIGATLEQAGYEVAVASDGIEALAKVEGSPPDLILLDVWM